VLAERIYDEWGHTNRTYYPKALAAIQVVTEIDRQAQVSEEQAIAHLVEEATTLFHLRRYDEAENILRPILETHPQYAPRNALNAMGYLKWSRHGECSGFLKKRWRPETWMRRFL